jgi:hypothetical protein
MEQFLKKQDWKLNNQKGHDFTAFPINFNWLLLLFIFLSMASGNPVPRLTYNLPDSFRFQHFFRVQVQDHAVVYGNMLYVQIFCDNF